jgi:hypothetical protein
MAIIFADGVTIEFSETNQNVSYASLNVMKLKAEGLAISADNLYNEQDGVLGWTATYQNTTNTNNENEQIAPVCPKNFIFHLGLSPQMFFASSLDVQDGNSIA